MPASNRTFQFNPEQQAAIDHPLAPLMIVAGPGTGKTATLVGRIVQLIRGQGLSPGRILTLTFTEKAADEIQGRIRAQLGAELGREPLSASTFHAFCYQAVLEFKPEFRTRRLMSDGDILFLLRERYGELPDLQSVELRRDPVQAGRTFQRFFARLRDELIAKEDFSRLLAETEEGLRATGNEGWEEQLRQLRDHCAVFPYYQRWKAEEEFIDYGDMIAECWRLMQDEPQALATLQSRYKTIIVDEFQDNNHALNLLVALLAQPHQSITVVGDPDQCIYGFRGASNFNFTDFRRRYGDHSGFRELVLQRNYRSTQPILDLAEGVMGVDSGRPRKELNSRRGAGDRPVLVIGHKELQLEYLAQDIRTLDRDNETVSATAILVRSHRQADMVVAALNRWEIPTRHLRIDFFRLPAVKTILAWCAVVSGSGSRGIGLYRALEYWLERQPTPDEFAQVREQLAGNGQSFDEQSSLGRFVAVMTGLVRQAAQATAAELVWKILEDSGIFKRHWRAGYFSDRLAMVNLGLLYQRSAEFTAHHGNHSLNRFCSYMEVMREAGAMTARIPPLPTRTGEVQVMTVHQSKGLEFHRVYIPFLAANSFPLNFRPDKIIEQPPPDWTERELPEDWTAKGAHYEEERRILYVGITRAEQRLTLLAPPKRRSRFIRDLPNELYEEIEIMEATTQEEQSLHDEISSQLRRELTRELAGRHFDQARGLVEALRLVDEHRRGLIPDWDSLPRGAELRRKLAATEPGGQPDDRPLSLSSSSISTYEACALQYRFKYIDHIPDKVESRPYMVVGQIVHEVLEVYHRPALAGKRRPIREILQERWRPAEFTFEQVAGQHFEEAADMLGAYADRHPPDGPLVAAVEHWFEFPLEGTVIKGKIDRLDIDAQGRIRLIDYKTSRTPLSSSKAKQDMQLGLYSLYVEQAGDVELGGHALGRLPDEATLYYLRADEPEVTIQYGPGELDGHRERIAAVVAGIRQEQFPEAESEQPCRNCDYKDLICPKFDQSGD